MRCFKPYISVVICLFTLHLCVFGQDSAGRTYIVDQKHSQASDHGNGTASEPFSTINQAAMLARPGDTILVYSGVYRERVAPAMGGAEGRPIVYQAAKGEAVYIKGSDLWQPDWQPVKDEEKIYFGAFKADMFQTEDLVTRGFKNFPSTFNPYTVKLRAAPGGQMLTLGQLFVNGQPFLEVDNRESLRKIPGSWMVNEAKTGLYVHFQLHSMSPENFQVELTVRPRVFAPYKRGLGYIHVRGFIMEHGATDFPANFWTVRGAPQAGIFGCRGGHHWVIEDNTVRFAKTVGIDIGSEGPIDADSLQQSQPENTGDHLIRNNKIMDNGSAGIIGIRSYRTRIINNQFERNNRLGFSAPEIGAIKLHFFTEGLIESNLLRHNYCYGIWLDNVWHHSRVTRNVLVSNQGAGIFIELGNGPLLVDNNIVALTHNTLGLAGDGVYSHDASGVTLAHNLIFFNANFGVWAHVATDRKIHGRGEGNKNRSLSRASDWKIVNNMIIGNHLGAIGLPVISERSKNNFSDYNLITAGYNRVTSETYALELDHPLFLMNTNKGRVAWPLGANRSAQKIVDGGSAASPLLQVEEWQQFTGHDRHSLVPKVLRPLLREETLLLNFIIDNSPQKIKAPKIKEIDRDFYGNPMPDKPFPGPFQQLKMNGELEDRSKVLEFRGPYNHIKSTKENLNSFILWPTAKKNNTMNSRNQGAKVLEQSP